MAYAQKLEDSNFNYYDNQFDLTRYMSLAKLVTFSDEREHTDGLCCFLPTAWRIDKQVVPDIYLIHGTLVPSGETHHLIYEGKAPSIEIPLDASEEKIKSLLEELEELLQRTPCRKELIPEGERFKFEGYCLPACSNLDFKINEDGKIINSCLTYLTRDKYCQDYPAYGTSEMDPFCLYDGWSTQPNVFELEKGLKSNSDPKPEVQIKLFAVKSNRVVPQNLVLSQLQLEGQTYNLIPVPLPKRCCGKKCLEHPKYRKTREEQFKKELYSLMFK